MKKAKLLVTIGAVFCLAAIVIAWGPATELAPGTSPTGQNGFDAFGDELFRYDIETAPNDNRCLAVEFVFPYFYVTGRGHVDDPDPIAKVHTYDVDGNYVSSFEQGTSSGWGWRDMAWDGEYIYTSDSINIDRFSLDGTTIEYDVITGPIDPCRALAYDPATDHFWVTGFSQDIYEIDRDGAIINQYANSTLSFYGAAWDPVSAGGPFLWLSDLSDNMIKQFDPVTGTFTGVTITPTYNVPGGLTFTTEWAATDRAGILVGLDQTEPDSVFGVEVMDPAPCWNNVLECSDTFSGTNIGFADDLHDYSCVGWNESAGEVVYKLELGDEAILDIDQLSNDFDADIFLLTDCDDPSTCLYFADTNMNTGCLAAGTYYLVVDGYNGGEGYFSYSIDCLPCADDDTIDDDTIDDDTIDDDTIDDDTIDDDTIDDDTIDDDTIDDDTVDCIDCSNPYDVVIIPDDLDYSHLSATTCGACDNYEDTCLGYYDGGEDTIYTLAVTSGTWVEIMLDPKTTTWTGIALADECPPGSTCISTSTNTSAGIHGLSCQYLEAGTYTIMVDTWPSPDCIPDYDLFIAECVPIDDDTIDDDTIDDDTIDDDTIDDDTIDDDTVDDDTIDDDTIDDDTIDDDTIDDDTIDDDTIDDDVVDDDVVDDDVVDDDVVDDDVVDDDVVDDDVVDDDVVDDDVVDDDTVDDDTVDDDTIDDDTIDDDIADDDASDDDFIPGDDDTGPPIGDDDDDDDSSCCGC